MTTFGSKSGKVCDSSRAGFVSGEYTTGEAAKIIGVSVWTLHRWLKRGWIPEPCRDRRNKRVFEREHIEVGLSIKNRRIAPLQRNTGA